MRADNELRLRLSLSIREYRATIRAIRKAQEFYGEYSKESLELEHVVTALAEGSFIE